MSKAPQSPQSPPSQQSPQLSALAKGLIADLRNCIVTNTTKAEVIGKSALTSHEMIDGRYNSSMSTIEGLGARAMMSFLSPEEIQLFVTGVHEAEIAHRSFVTDPVEAAKGSLSAAKTEAALKGYVLPVSRGGPFDEIPIALSETEREIAFAAAKEALLAVANKGIPTAEYEQRIKEEYEKIVSKSGLEPERLAVVKSYASHGTKRKQGQDLSQPEKDQIREAALKTSEEFSKIFASHKDKIQNAGQNVVLQENLQERLNELLNNVFKQQGYVIDPETSKELSSLVKEKTKSLDAGSISGDNIRELAGRFGKDLFSESPRLIVLQAIKDIEKGKGITVSESQAKKIVDKLSPALAKLDPEYLKENSGGITGKIQKEVISQSVTTLSMFGGLYIREESLDRVYSGLLDEHLKSSDAFQISKIEQGLRGLKDSQIAERLTQLGVEKAKAARYDVNQISEHNLVEMRRENPGQFDRIIFKKNIIAKSQKEVVSDIIDKAIEKLKEKNRVKLTPQREIYLKKKFKEQLTPTLSKLDPEYLQKQRDIISSTIQEELYNKSSVGYYAFRGEFSVSSASLSRISSVIGSKYQQESVSFEHQTVKTGLDTTKLISTELEQRLNALGVEKAKAVKFNASQISAEDLLKMRKENPARFDRVVLEVGKGKAAAKQAAVAPVKDKEKIQEVATPIHSSVRVPPPLLSTLQSPVPIPQKVAVASVQEEVVTTGKEGVRPPLPPARSAEQLRSARPPLPPARQGLVGGHLPKPPPGRGGASTRGGGMSH